MLPDERNHKIKKIKKDMNFDFNQVKSASSLKSKDIGIFNKEDIIEFLCKIFKIYPFDNRENRDYFIPSDFKIRDNVISPIQYKKYDNILSILKTTFDWSNEKSFWQQLLYYLEKNPIKYKGTILIRWPYCFQECEMMSIEQLEIVNKIFEGSFTNISISITSNLKYERDIREYIEAKNNMKSFKLYLEKTSKILTSLINKSDKIGFYFYKSDASFSLYEDIFLYGIKNMNIDFYDKNRIMLTHDMEEALHYFGI